jgi:hypothetical protein
MKGTNKSKFATVEDYKEAQTKHKGRVHLSTLDNSRTRNVST